MNREQLLIEVAEHHWYQSIELGEGLITPGETGEATRHKLEMMDLPSDMSGMSVLDIGCNEGFFAFEAERRGANRVMALDKSREAAAKFDLVKRTLGDVDRRHADVDREGTPECRIRRAR